ncbi:hypothetical protein RhiirB3_435955, partial [Rhizophagus irregularis]
PGHIVRNCPDRNNNTTSVANNGEGRTNPQPTSVGNSNNNQLAQLQQLLAQLVPQETDKDQTTRSKARLNPLEGIAKDKTLEEDEAQIRVTQFHPKKKQPIKTAEPRRTVLQKNTKKKPTTTAPINKMVEPYTPQQFFDQVANITNGQLLAMNPKFGLTIAKQLRKPVMRKKDEDSEKIQTKNAVNNETPEDGGIAELQDLMQANTSSNSKSSALYCDASIKHIQFPLILDSGSAGDVIKVSTECRETPHHIISIEVPDIEPDKEPDDEPDDEAIEDSDEEYESEDETTQEQLYCHTQFITQKEAQEIEDGLRGTALIENDYYYQYKEIEMGNFHTGTLDENQQQQFHEFIKKYNNLFAWNSNDFGRTSVVTHNIDTGSATPIKQ